MQKITYHVWVIERGTTTQTHKADNIARVYALNGNNKDQKKNKLYDLGDSSPESFREYK